MPGRKWNKTRHGGVYSGSAGEVGPVEKRVLNDTFWISRFLQGKDLSIELAKSIARLKGSAYDAERATFDYSGARRSQEFREYELVARALNKYPLAAVDTREKKLAYWINIYNALVVHGIVSLGVAKSVKDVSGFFETAAYQIDGHVFSLDDIEHGLLRCNRAKYLSPFKPFAKDDPRLRFAMDRIDPRIHFALICGTRSCPPFAVYRPESIDAQLDIATATVLNDEVTIERGSKTVRVSKIFQWYKKDFGDRQDIVRFIARHLREAGDQIFLMDHIERISLAYLDFDWSLNHSGAA